MAKYTYIIVTQPLWSPETPPTLIKAPKLIKVQSNTPLLYTAIRGRFEQSSQARLDGGEEAEIYELKDIEHLSTIVSSEYLK